MLPSGDGCGSSIWNLEAHSTRSRAGRGAGGNSIFFLFFFGLEGGQFEPGSKCLLTQPGDYCPLLRNTSIAEGTGILYLSPTTLSLPYPTGSTRPQYLNT